MIRKNINTLLLITGLSLAMISPLKAETDPIIYGSGTLTCANWSTRFFDDSHWHKVEWINGYITAVENYSSKRISHNSYSRLVAWMDQYCLRNPRKELSGAVNELVNAVSKSSK